MDQVPALVEPFLWRAASHSMPAGGAAEWLWCHDGADGATTEQDDNYHRWPFTLLQARFRRIQFITPPLLAVLSSQDEEAYVEMDEAREPIATFQDEDSDQEVNPADLY